MHIIIPRGPLQRDRVREGRAVVLQALVPLPPAHTNYSWGGLTIISTTYIS